MTTKDHLSVPGTADRVRRAKNVSQKLTKDHLSVPGTATVVKPTTTVTCNPASADKLVYTPLPNRRYRVREATPADGALVMRLFEQTRAVGFHWEQRAIAAPAVCATLTAFVERLLAGQQSGVVLILSQHEHEARKEPAELGAGAIALVGNRALGVSWWAQPVNYWRAVAGRHLDRVMVGWAFQHRAMPVMHRFLPHGLDAIAAAGAASNSHTCGDMAS